MRKIGQKYIKQLRDRKQISGGPTLPRISVWKLITSKFMEDSKENNYFTELKGKAGLGKFRWLEITK